MSNTFTDPIYIKSKPNTSYEYPVGDADPSSRADVLNRVTKALAANFKRLINTLVDGQAVDLTDASTVSAYGCAGQLKFPATQNSSADVNTLDDYQEGSWTPTLCIGGSAQPMGYQLGRYTKVGNVVHLEFKVSWSSKTASGAVTVTGLPFASDTTSGLTISLVSGCPAGSITSTHSLFYNIDPNTTVLHLADQAGDILDGSVAAAGSIMGSGTFRAA